MHTNTHIPNRSHKRSTSTFFLFLVFGTLICQAQTGDWRSILNGQRIYAHGYIDQPYIVQTSDGTWVCTFTTSPGKEGDQVQYIVSTSSVDQGKTWTDPIEIEAAGNGIEASWAMPLITNFDRIYVFYTYNGDTVRNMPDGRPIRSDTHGWYCYRYSEDKGKTWSERYRLDMRQTAVDRSNDFSGEVQMFWGIGKPVTKENDMWFSFTKLGKYFLQDGEGWIYHSDNILTEPDVSKVNWQLLPEGDHGIKNAALGSVQEEFNIQPMNIAGGLYCVYRTTLGQPAHSYSYDGGKTWTSPELMHYANGMPLRNPRACPRLWKCKNGNYLLWYHNNGGRDYSHRNPVWVSGGVEKNGRIYWSQPEILIHGPDRSYDTGRFSYPDLVESDGRYWISTTQKTTATVHEVPASFFERLWGQFDEPALERQGLIAESERPAPVKKIRLKEPLTMREGGFALDFWINLESYSDATVLKSGVTRKGGSFTLALTEGERLTFTLTNGRDTVTMSSDMNRLQLQKEHHIAILVDGDAGICYMLLDGSISDGGCEELFGFSWLDSLFENLKVKDLVVGEFPGAINNLRVYGQQMFASQFVGNYRKGLPTKGVSLVNE